MSYQTASSITIGESAGGAFSGGYADNTPSVSLGANMSPYLRNARLDGHSIVIRGGREVYADLAEGDYPRGIGAYVAADPLDSFLLVRHNISATEKLYRIQLEDVPDGNSVDTSTYITDDARMRIIAIGSAMYCMNGVDPFGKYVSNTYSTPNVGISNFAPAFSAVFNGCHWASGRDTNENKVYKSVADNYEDFNSSGSDQFTFGERVVGLCATSSALFYFTPSTISVTGQNDIQETAGTITYFTRKLEASEGAVNHHSTIAVGSTVYYLTPSNSINRIVQGGNVNGFEVLDLTDRPYKGITGIMSTLDRDQSASFAQYYPGEMLIKWHLKSIGSTINDTVIVYDIVKDRFFIDDNVFYYGGISLQGYNYTLSMVEPKVYRDEINNDDEDSPIPFEYWTNEFYLGGPTGRFTLWESSTLVDINPLASLTQEIRVDGGQVDTKTIDSDNVPIDVGGLGTEAVGTYAVGTDGLGDIDDDYNEVLILRTKGNLNKRGRKVQFRYSCGTVGAKVRLKSLEVVAEKLPGATRGITT